MRAIVAVAALALAGCVSAPDRPAVELMVAGPPVAAADTATPMIYEVPALTEGEVSGGMIEQGWSLLGREDRAASVSGGNEYNPAACAAKGETVSGTDAILDALVSEAAGARVVIINESHHVTRHRDFSRRLVERLRPLGYTVFAAETFANRDDGPDPVDDHAMLTYPHMRDGWYSGEPVFGRLVRTARQSGYRLAAYEQVHDPDAPRDEDWRVRVAAREQAQADNLGAILSAMGPDEKLVVHVGYSHADEREIEDEHSAIWMAARLRRLTGIDPLTIGQTICRGGSEEVRLLPMPDDGSAPFDFAIDHPLDGFRYGRAAWRFDGKQAVGIPQPFAGSAAPLVVEAFREGEPFDAVPEDRVYFEPGEDVRLALPPGRYVVRAVRLPE
ncbi:hypothetical protein VCJ71_10440 [Alteriqipengyuania sp. WL0013]|uniref:hypothetical protein n=1 Tax=Alteriqipengyuania sp. WL0013 TaxID=3110773 RepID=UPI002C828066|nr:hypothetical protein [Alteriqipengyuania sp. WL0013]MEB3416485.1 hypothetical protein [Alteriqipengyuania sp. WL0013]